MINIVAHNICKAIIVGVSDIFGSILKNISRTAKYDGICIR